MCYFRIPFVQLKRNERYTNLNKPNRCKILCISMFPNDNSMKMSLNNEKTHLKRIYTWWTYTTDKYFEGKNETETKNNYLPLNETTRSYHKPQIQDFIQSIQFLLLSLLQTHLSCSTANYSIIIFQFIYYWIRSKFIWIFNNFQPKVETNAWTMNMNMNSTIAACMREMNNECIKKRLLHFAFIKMITWMKEVKCKSLKRGE